MYPNERGGGDEEEHQREWRTCRSSEGRRERDGLGVVHRDGETADVGSPPALAALEATPCRGPHRAELQVPLATGETRWLECRGAVARDERGMVTGITGAVVDITDRKREQEAARHEMAVRLAALEERDELLRLLQRGLLPPQLPSIEGVDLAARYLPMGAGIGGDFYDVFPLTNGTWGIMLGTCAARERQRQA